MNGDLGEDRTLDGGRDIKMFADAWKKREKRIENTKIPKKLQYFSFSFFFFLSNFSFFFLVNHVTEAEPTRSFLTFKVIFDWHILLLFLFIVFIVFLFGFMNSFCVGFFFFCQEHVLFDFL